MKKYSKLIIAAIIALIFIGTFVFLWQKSQPKEVVYTEFTPKNDSIQKTTIITGKIEPRNEVNIKPQISGIIAELMKEPGQYVQQGEVIAKVKVIPDMGQLSSAESRVRLSGINLKQCEVNFQRDEALYQQKVISADEFEKTRQALQQAREEKMAAEDALQVVRFDNMTPVLLDSERTENTVSFETEGFDVFGIGNALVPVTDHENELVKVEVLSFSEDAPVNLAEAEAPEVIEGLEVLGTFTIEDNTVTTTKDGNHRSEF